MALLDIFKRKKEVKKVSASAKPARPAGGATADKEKAAPVKPQVKTIKKVSRLAARVLKEPHVTEKATDLVSKNQYVFKVWPRSNKSEIKQAVEELYGVNVLNVSIINIPAKQRRLGRITGERGGYKKAVVKIKEGQKIEVLPR